VELTWSHRRRSAPRISMLSLGMCRPTSRCSGRSRRRDIGVTSTNRSCGGLAAERQSVGQSGPRLGVDGVLAATAIYSWSGSRCRPSAVFAACGGGSTGSVPKVVGIDHWNCREEAAAPPYRSRWGGRRAGHDRRGFAFAIISRPTDLNGYDQQQRTGRHFGPGPGRPSRPLDELAQLPGGDATVARVQLGLGGRRSLIGRSRCPTRRCTGRSPRASARNTKAHGGLGRRCIIDLPFRASPVNGKAFDGRTLAGVTSFRQRPELEKRYNRQHHCQ
jgi:hypothetical protein